MIKETIPELKRLSPAQKFALAIELWDELASNPDEIPVTDEQLNELDRRFDDYQRNPDKVVSWQDVKARILSMLEPRQADRTSRIVRRLPGDGWSIWRSSAP